MAQHSILVGVDESEASKDAVRWAVGAMRDGDTLCLITVAAGPDATRHAPEVLATMQEAAHAAGAPPDRVVTHVAPKTGVSGATLTAYAEPDKCKLLVVGSRGLSAFRLAVGSLFGIGSVSAYVLQHARLPTAVVQEGTVITNAAASQPVSQQPHRVCMALDDSVPAAHARDWALANLVRLDKDELFLISVMVMPELEPAPVVVFTPLDPKDPDSTTMPVIAYKDGRRAAIEQATAVVSEASAKATQAGVPKSRIVTAVLDAVKDGSGDVASAIVRYAAAYKVYALCMGHRGGHGVLAAVGVGSVARKVVEDASCPVVVVRAAEEPQSPRAHK